MTRRRSVACGCLLLLELGLGSGARRADARPITFGAGLSVLLEQEYSGAEEGSVVWDAARCLMSYVAADGGALHPRDKRVLEIGSGTGAVGLACALLGARSVVLTDKPTQLPLVARNVELNRPTCAESAELVVAPLCWGDDWQRDSPRLAQRDAFDLVVVADCV